MEGIQAGIWSVLPPVLAIGLALATKEVYSSLMVGILTGGAIYAWQTGSGVMTVLEASFGLMAEKAGDNMFILLFLALLGGLVVVITRAGGSLAYGKWASGKIRTRSQAALATSAMGVLIFIDDYFNCLTVGTVMRPVTDRFKISRAKLAYILDATAAPVCIIAPVSSWAASVISYMEGTGLEGMSAFVGSIPFNLYALLTIVMVLVVATGRLDFGPMARFEQQAQEGVEEHAGTQGEGKVSARGSMLDLLVPIGALILFSVLGMLYVGGYFAGGMTLAEAFGNTDASVGITYGAFGALAVALALFVPRRLMTFSEFFEGLVQGVQSMASAFMILILAWTISGICRDLLGTGEFVGEWVKTSQLPAALIPAIIFAVAGALSFAMGTSWGTFGILIPIVAVVCQAVAPELMLIALSATLAGSVFGDHCSPISDTTILSSTGAGCNHLNHVSSQLPYVLVVAAGCFAGYIVAGFTRSALLSLAVALAVLFLQVWLLHRLDVAKGAKAS